jgi:hypothetical protein
MSTLPLGSTVAVCARRPTTIKGSVVQLLYAGATTSTAAIADFEGSAWLVATTWKVPRPVATAPGAVYRPGVVVPPTGPSCSPCTAVLGRDAGGEVS